jgi:hypothetical protein
MTHQLSSRRYLAVMVATIWLLRPASVRAAEAQRPGDAPSDLVVEQVSAELARLGRAADREERRSPNRPGPSREVAYFILGGLAARGPAPEPLDAETIARLRGPAGPPPFLVGHDPRTRRTIVRSSPRVWIVFVESEMQDKSGTFVQALAVLFLKASGGWSERGRGETAWSVRP